MIYDKQAVTIFANTFKTLSMFTKRKFSITNCRLGGKIISALIMFYYLKKTLTWTKTRGIMCNICNTNLQLNKNVARFDLFHSYCIHLLNVYPIFKFYLYFTISISKLCFFHLYCLAPVLILCIYIIQFVYGCNGFYICFCFWFVFFSFFYKGSNWFNLTLPRS